MLTRVETNKTANSGEICEAVAELAAHLEEASIWTFQRE
jgi:hypothetical protein